MLLVLVQDIIQGFVESRLIMERKAKDDRAVKDALYRNKNKTKESIYENDEEKEEEEALRQHFPDHILQVRIGE